MAECFEIIRDGRQCGQARVEKEGLYYRFSCRCRLTGGEMQRLVVSCGEKREDLGVCVPMDGQFGVEKRLPWKRLGEGAMEFRLVPKDKQAAQDNQAVGVFVPVSQEEPFPALHRLNGAVLENRAGQVGIVCKEE